MRERGIIFNAEMVRAILDGRKIQTRRIVKNVMPDNGMWLKKPTKTRSGTTTHVLDAPKHNLCPLGKVGDRLWVRETFGNRVVRDALGGYGEFITYRASKPDAVYCTCASGDVIPMKWTPSIHMPRWASRITLEITDVRVERLKDAGDTEFKAEGYPLGRELTGGSMDPFCWFRNLWDSVSPTNFKYGDNPWVWVIEFKRV